MAVTKKATKVSKSSKTVPSKTAPSKAVAPKPAVTAKTAAAKPAPPKTDGKADRKKTAALPAPKKTAAARRSSADGNGRAGFVDNLARRLDEHRREILHLYRHDLDVGLDAFRDGDDEIDRANFDSDRDLALSLSDNERETLLQIEEALRRIARGDFGSCTSCSKPIGDQRLDAIPWARYCIDCQELEEKGLLG
jgi:DnaK suppressor protein